MVLTHPIDAELRRTATRRLWPIETETEHNELSMQYTCSYMRYRVAKWLQNVATVVLALQSVQKEKDEAVRSQVRCEVRGGRAKDA